MAHLNVELLDAAIQSFERSVYGFIMKGVVEKKLSMDFDADQKNL